MPFVQGHLRDEPISVTIRSECAHCSRPLEIEIQNDLRCRVESEQVEAGADPLIFVPIVDFEKLKDPSIIDAF